MRDLIPTVSEVLLEGERVEEKYFTWEDKTGREGTVEVTGTDIRRTWDLNMEDWVTDMSLGEFLKECYIGDVWENRTERLTCDKIY